MYIFLCVIAPMRAFLRFVFIKCRFRNSVLPPSILSNQHTQHQFSFNNLPRFHFLDTCAKRRSSERRIHLEFLYEKIKRCWSGVIRLLGPDNTPKWKFHFSFIFWCRNGTHTKAREWWNRIKKINRHGMNGRNQRILKYNLSRN
jgi:hypothetical protein